MFVFALPISGPGPGPWYSFVFFRSIWIHIICLTNVEFDKWQLRTRPASFSKLVI